MKLGVFSVLLADKPLETALDTIKGMGFEAVELGCGGYSGKAHCDPAVLLADDKALIRLTDAVEKRGLFISGLSVHGNPVHPNKGMAEMYHKDWQNAIRLAGRLGIERVITFSGCPGGSAKDTTPNWVTCPWPNDFTAIIDYQWDVLERYWSKAAKEAADEGVDKIALELHPGFCVYNTETLLKLRGLAGPAIGANLDPSHLFWQGMDPVACIRALKGCIWHFHAKDCRTDPYNVPVNGVLDTKRFTDEANRAWVFRTVGYGHDMQTWRDIISSLRMTGYDYVISIEHEDSLMSAGEGLTKAAEFLKKAMITEPAGGVWFTDKE